MLEIAEFIITFGKLNTTWHDNPGLAGGSCFDTQIIDYVRILNNETVTAE